MMMIRSGRCCCCCRTSCCYRVQQQQQQQQKLRSLSPILSFWITTETTAAAVSGGSTIDPRLPRPITKVLGQRRDFSGEGEEGRGKGGGGGQSGYIFGNSVRPDIRNEIKYEEPRVEEEEKKKESDNYYEVTTMVAGNDNYNHDDCYYDEDSMNEYLDLLHKFVLKEERVWAKRGKRPLSDELVDPVKAWLQCPQRIATQNYILPISSIRNIISDNRDSKNNNNDSVHRDVNDDNNDNNMSLISLFRASVYKQREYFCYTIMDWNEIQSMVAERALESMAIHCAQIGTCKPIKIIWNKLLEGGFAAGITGTTGTTETTSSTCLNEEEGEKEEGERKRKGRRKRRSGVLDMNTGQQTLQTLLYVAVTFPEHSTSTTNKTSRQQQQLKQQQEQQRKRRMEYARLSGKSNKNSSSYSDILQSVIHPSSSSIEHNIITNDNDNNGKNNDNDNNDYNDKSNDNDNANNTSRDYMLLSSASTTTTTSIPSSLELADEIAIYHDTFYESTSQTVDSRVRMLVLQGMCEHALRLLKLYETTTTTATNTMKNSNKRERKRNNKSIQLKLRSYTPVLRLLFEQHKLQQAMTLFKRMKYDLPLVLLDEETYVHVIEACAKHGLFCCSSSSTGNTNKQQPQQQEHDDSNISQWGPKLFDELVMEMHDDFVQISSSSSKRIQRALQQGFTDTSSAEPTDSSSSFSFSDPSTSTSSGSSSLLHTGYVAIDPSKGCCPSTNIQLRLIPLTDAEKIQIRDQLFELAKTNQNEREKKKKFKQKNRRPADYELEKFFHWLDVRIGRPYTVIIDGGNVGYHMHNNIDGQFHFHSIYDMVNVLEEEYNEHVLVTLPAKYKNRFFYISDRPGTDIKNKNNEYIGRYNLRRQYVTDEERHILDELRRQGKICFIPPGHSDDLYWILATMSNQTKSRNGQDLFVYPTTTTTPQRQQQQQQNTNTKNQQQGTTTRRWPGLRPFVITNDKIRDHRLALMMNERLYNRWRSNFVVNYNFIPNKISNNYYNYEQQPRVEEEAPPGHHHHHQQQQQGFTAGGGGGGGGGGHYHHYYQHHYHHRQHRPSTSNPTPTATGLQQQQQQQQRKNSSHNFSFRSVDFFSFRRVGFFSREIQRNNYYIDIDDNSDDDYNNTNNRKDGINEKDKKNKKIPVWHFPLSDRDNEWFFVMLPRNEEEHDDDDKRSSSISSSSTLSYDGRTVAARRNQQQQQLHPRKSKHKKKITINTGGLFERIQQIFKPNNNNNKNGR